MLAHGPLSRRLGDVKSWCHELFQIADVDSVSWNKEKASQRRRRTPTSTSWRALMAADIATDCGAGAAAGRRFNNAHLAACDAACIVTTMCGRCCDIQAIRRHTALSLP